MSDRSGLYLIEFDHRGGLIVNSTALDVPAKTPEERLSWALEQVAGAHAALPPGSVMRVEVVDERRLHGFGRFATDVPYGSRVTLGMVRDHADTSRVRRFGDNADGVVYDVEYGPLHPIPQALDAGRDSVARKSVTWGEKKRFPFVPKEPLPQIAPRKSPEQEKLGILRSWSRRRKAALAAGGAVVAAACLGAVAMGGGESSHARVCVNNLSYQRVASAMCQESDDATSRWWYIQPGKNVPAVGDFVEPAAGTFSSPASGASVDLEPPAEGSSAGGVGN